MPTSTVEPVEVENPHPGAGPDPSDFYDMFGGPRVETGSNDAVVEEVQIIGSPQMAGVNANINLDLNRAFADMASALKNAAQIREEQGIVKFNGLDSVAELEVFGRPNFLGVSEVHVLFVMRDGTMWLDTNHNNIGDLHIIQNPRSGSLYYDRDSDGIYETVVPNSGGLFW